MISKPYDKESVIMNIPSIYALRDDQRTLSKALGVATKYNFLVDLEATLNTALEEIENNYQFRYCRVDDTIYLIEKQKLDDDYKLEFITSFKRSRNISVPERTVILLKDYIIEDLEELLKASLECNFSNLCERNISTNSFIMIGKNGYSEAQVTVLYNHCGIQKPAETIIVQSYKEVNDVIDGITFKEHLYHNTIETDISGDIVMKQHRRIKGTYLMEDFELTVPDTVELDTVKEELRSLHESNDTTDEYLYQ